MASESLRRLRLLAEADEDVMAAVRAAATREDVVRIAGQHDIELDPSDLDPAADTLTAEVTGADLEAAAGGWHPKYGTFSADCI